MLSREELTSLHVFQSRKRAEGVGGVGLYDPISTVPAKP
jgi:hypothetical protein